MTETTEPSARNQPDQRWLQCESEKPFIQWAAVTAEPENPGNRDSSGLNRTSPPSGLRELCRKQEEPEGGRETQNTIFSMRVLSSGTHSSCDYLSKPTQLGPSILHDGATLLLQDLQAVNG